MKTSDVSSNKPVQQQSPDASQTQAKKPTKDFKEVLDQPGSKTPLAGKKKSTFSPLSVSQEKSGKLEKLQTQTSKGHARVEEKETHDSIGEAELGKGKKKKTESVEENVQVQPNLMTAGPGPVHTAAKAEKTQATAGLRMEEIQSIVQKVHVGINEQGKPEMNFQIQTHNLGPMDLKVSADGDKIKLDIATDDINAQNVLKEHLDELSNQLREKGLTLAQTNFSSRDQDKDEQQQQQQEQAWEGPMYAPTARPKKGFNL